MRRGIADLGARTEVSEASNRRYLDALAGADTTKLLGRGCPSACEIERGPNPLVGLGLYESTHQKEEPLEEVYEVQSSPATSSSFGTQAARFGS